MRLRNVKNKQEIMDSSNYLITDYIDNKGKWNKIFNNDNPIYLEIGMGKGKFIIEQAKANPGINYIGIERFDSVIAKGLQKIPEGINNLLMIRCNALEIDNIFKKEIDRLYLNFSDPWPKKRHHFRRLTSDIYLEKYNNIFKNDKVIEMRTDNRDLFQYSLIHFSKNGYVLEDLSLDLHVDNMPLITTEYEDRFSKENKPIYYVLVKKRDV